MTMIKIKHIQNSFLLKILILGSPSIKSYLIIILDIDSGEVVTSKVLSIKKGEQGLPGEIRGTILNQKAIADQNDNQNLENNDDKRDGIMCIFQII